MDKKEQEETDWSERKEGLHEKRQRTEKNERRRWRVERKQVTLKLTLSSCQSRSKKGRITNIFLTDYGEVIVDFMRGHVELYNKTNQLPKN